MKKKTLSKVLAVLLCSSFILTSCGKSDDKKESTTTVPETTTQEETTKKLEGEEVAANIATTQNVIDDNYRNYYEIFVASYCDSNGDGIGDLQGLISKLDYLNDGDPTTDTDLGINGIWLMPISPSPTYHKYDVSDYYGIDSSYGTMDDFKQLVAECDKRGIKIIIDFVMNHSSVQNPWFKEMKDYITNLPAGQEPNAADCKYVDYYNIVKGSTTANYYQIGSSDYYYEAQFTETMPDLNLANPEVRKEFEDISKFWMDLGIAGFRLDAIKEYYTGNTTANVEVLTWFNSYVKGLYPDAYIVGEAWTGDYTSYLASGIDSVFDFGYANLDGVIALVSQQNMPETYNGKYFGQCLVDSLESIYSNNQNAIMAPFIGNHDLNRSAQYLAFDQDKIKFAQGLLAIMNGSSFIYYGDEIGIGGAGVDENKRSPMIWSTTDNTGLTNGPANMEKDYVINKFDSVEEQEKDNTSILSYVKQGLKLRNIFPEISRGTVAQISEVTDDNILAITKTYNDSKIVILANTSATDTAYATVPRQTYGYSCIQGMLTVGDDKPYQVGDTIALPPRSIVILK